jgi:hypothetical protein
VVVSDIPGRRLRNQHVTRAVFRRPADLVGWFGAMQAQEFEVAKWAIGLRLQDGSSDTQVARAFDQGRILRTHVMRPTWHFVTPADIRWMQELTGPRVHRIAASYNRRLELDTRTLTRGTAVIERALRDRQHLTRTELAERLRRAGLPMSGQRLAHQMLHAELEAVVCSGPRRGKQFTYALVAERAPNAKSLSRDEAIALLTRRYFSSHGPATIRDFVWWSGLTTAEARRGLEMNRVRREQIDGLSYWSIGSDRAVAPKAGLVYLLPIYDEYLIAYRDRQAVPHSVSVLSSASGGAVTFQHAVVIRGQVAGTWRIARQGNAIQIAIWLLRPITDIERRALVRAAARYERFMMKRGTSASPSSVQIAPGAS